MGSLIVQIPVVGQWPSFSKVAKNDQTSLSAERETAARRATDTGLHQYSGEDFGSSTIARISRRFGGEAMQGDEGPMRTGARGDGARKVRKPESQP